MHQNPKGTPEAAHLSKVRWPRMTPIMVTPQSRPPIEPYRMFFPLGVGYAALGAGLWLVALPGWVPYPAALHRMLMIQGFELCFVVGFLLTALPGLTHSRPTTRAESGTAFAALALFGPFALVGLDGAAHVCALLALLGVVAAMARRLPRASQKPPAEFVHVGLGMLFGITGSVLLIAQSFGAQAFGPPRFADHLLSIGMLLTLVLGVGSLLVPTFIGMRGPLEIPGIAKAHEWLPKFIFHASIAALFVGAFALEAMDAPLWGARLRAAAATIVLAMAWKLHRGPGRGDRSAWSMWGAGAFMLIGLWLAALGSHWTLAGLHIVFIGGFGLLTFAIATRVVIAHGKHGFPSEHLLLKASVVTLLLAALAARVIGELRPERALHWYALSGAVWTLACIVWFSAAWPRIRHNAVPAKPASN